MIRQQEILLQLLKVGLGGQANENIQEFDEATLKDVYRLASEQAVRGVAFQGLQKLNPNRTGSTEIVLEWYAAARSIESRNILINDAAPEIYEIFKEHGFRPVLMKGPVVAREYVLPLIRESGDIDLYFSEQEGRSAIEMVKSWQLKVEGQSIRDVSFNYKNIKVEVHPLLVHSLNPGWEKHTDRLQKWFEETIPSCPTLQLGSRNGEVVGPTLLLNLIYELYHIWIHLVKEGGIGLRQICDWAMCLHNGYGKYDVEELRQKLEDFGLMRPWIVFGGILVDYLGLRVEEVPFYKKSPKTKKILKIIFEEGNFGHNIKQEAVPEEKVAKMFRRIWDTVSRYWKLCGIFPIDAARFLPGVKSITKYL